MTRFIESENDSFDLRLLGSFRSKFRGGRVATFHRLILGKRCLKAGLNFGRKCRSGMNFKTRQQDDAVAGRKGNILRSWHVALRQDRLLGLMRRGHKCDLTGDNGIFQTGQFNAFTGTVIVKLIIDRQRVAVVAGGIESLTFSGFEGNLTESRTGGITPIFSSRQQNITRRQVVEIRS